ncbi:MAG: hypothetical protein HKN42_16115 [Granulosicoccus sp.]|nr:hypothetical protein [Granulosicoccus sp.]
MTHHGPTRSIAARSGFWLHRGLARVQGAILILIISLGAPGAVLADTQPPSAPGSLQGIRYSSTAGEILWTAATDDTFVVGYRVVRNGQSLGLRDAQSVYEPALDPGQAYTYRVSAVDRHGNEGAALVVQIAAQRGIRNTGVPAADTGDDGADASADASGGQTGGDSGGDQGSDQGSDTSAGSTGGVADGNLILYRSKKRATLVEGDAEGVSISLSVHRLKADKRAVTLSLVADTERDMLGLRHVFSSKVLASGESRATLNLALDVGVAPLMLHVRHFRIVADDGVSKAEKSLVIDVTPTAAPDVYLLIGQSNMEGYSEVGSRERYPGGQDERVERIRQLNVQPNSPAIFNRDELFTDEAANTKSPIFVPAEDPLHEPRYIGVDGKGATFVGLGLTFAKEASRASTANIYLVPAAWGATGFCANANGNIAWNAAPTSEDFLGGTLLTERALTRLNMTLRETGGVLRGILWHQGGADSNNAGCAATYADNLAKLVRRLRREARVDVRGREARGDEATIPFLLATQSKGDDERGRYSIFHDSKLQVDAAQRSIRSYVAYSDFVNNDDLVPPQYPCGQSSCVHFGADALREQGRRFYAAIQGIWGELGAYHY